MDTNFAMAIGFGVTAVSVCSFLAVASWSNTRRKEREAYYKNDALKKLAEMQGPIPEQLQ